MGLFLTQNHSLEVSLQEKAMFLSRTVHCRCEFPHLHLWGQPVSVFATVREEVLGLGRSKQGLARQLLRGWPDQPWS